MRGASSGTPRPCSSPSRSCGPFELRGRRRRRRRAVHARGHPTGDRRHRPRIAALRIRTPLPRLDHGRDSWPSSLRHRPALHAHRSRPAVDRCRARVGHRRHRAVAAAGAAALGIERLPDRGLSPMTMRRTRAGSRAWSSSRVVDSASALIRRAWPRSPRPPPVAANGIFTRRFLAGISPMTIALGQAISALVVMAVLAVVVEGAPSVTLAGRRRYRLARHHGLGPRQSCTSDSSPRGARPGRRP